MQRTVASGHQRDRGCGCDLPKKTLDPPRSTESLGEWLGVFPATHLVVNPRNPATPATQDTRVTCTVEHSPAAMLPLILIDTTALCQQCENGNRLCRFAKRSPSPPPITSAIRLLLALHTPFFKRVSCRSPSSRKNSFQQLLNRLIRKPFSLELGVDQSHSSQPCRVARLARTRPHG